MCEAGVNVKVIQDTLGHKDISTTLNIYTDVTKELRQSEFEGLDSYFKSEYAKALIDFIVKEYADKYSVLQVGTGDSPLTVPFYEKCGFVRSHIIPNFFIDNYDHPIFECGVKLVDMVIFQRNL